MLSQRKIICLEEKSYLNPYVHYAATKKKLRSTSSCYVLGQNKYGMIPLNLSLVAATLWNVWKARNQAIFRGKAPVALAIIDSAHATIKSYTRWNPGKSRGRNRGNVESQRGTARTRYVAPPAEGNSEPYESQPPRGG